MPLRIRTWPHKYAHGKRVTQAHLSHGSRVSELVDFLRVFEPDARIQLVKNDVGLNIRVIHKEA